MAASEAQIRANRENSKRSSGPKTEAGKAVSRGNAVTHALTATTVLPEREAAEVRRRFLAYCKELKPTGEVGMALTLRAATLSARMERCVEYETAMLTERVRQAEVDFTPPEGVDAAMAAKLRDEAGKRALFDGSKGAILARKYEAAAERGFLRCLKELRQHERAAEAANDAAIDEQLASFSGDEMSDEEFDRMCVEVERPIATKPIAPAKLGNLGEMPNSFDVPIASGKPR